MADNKMTTLLGGTEISAARLDGTTETVKVRQLPVRLLQTYLLKLDDEAAAIELFCDKPEGWADGLTLEAHTALITEGERLNKETFFGWLQRRIARQESLVPNSTGEAGKAVLSHSLTGLPKSA